ncbi:hypothetical protein [Protofrankia coriariae]|uniref:hypothetical protein n=1 Tax=Protofrankia coriariae TaxID=1562887 RepID=UPI00069BD592|nr:hypothetical protein [Protofrankia coriariae]ONH33763.1 hypothetical protein BL254_19420 [Protofrankia sp. BMG5.30]
MIHRQAHGFFVTDDNDAARLAARNNIHVVRTWHLLKIAAKADWIDADTLWGYLQTLRARRRGGPSGVTDRPSFDKWLAS